MYVRGNKVVDIVVTHNRALLLAYYTRTLVDIRTTWVKKKEKITTITFVPRAGDDDATIKYC